MSEYWTCMSLTFIFQVFVFRSALLGLCATKEKKSGLQQRPLDMTIFLLTVLLGTAM